eukprot:TRINITY_DN27188_c0_g1_i2.p1 TRINITY_DN27188_c0_g1~~TRINITY_DN27188_c0_g1_i2.p1  ORF type:complete len:916 (+),score=221.35 TRINITY_DN27188_c0_g1_i2:90-2750(+)
MGERQLDFPLLSEGTAVNAAEADAAPAEDEVCEVVDVVDVVDDSPPPPPRSLPGSLRPAGRGLAEQLGHEPNRRAAAARTGMSRVQLHEVARRYLEPGGTKTSTFFFLMRLYLTYFYCCAFLMFFLFGLNSLLLAVYDAAVPKDGSGAKRVFSGLAMLSVLLMQSFFWGEVLACGVSGILDLWMDAVGDNFSSDDASEAHPLALSPVPCQFSLMFAYGYKQRILRGVACCLRRKGVVRPAAVTHQDFGRFIFVFHLCIPVSIALCTLFATGDPALGYRNWQLGATLIAMILVVLRWCSLTAHLYRAKYRTAVRLWRASAQEEGAAFGLVRHAVSAMGAIAVGLQLRQECQAPNEEEEAPLRSGASVGTAEPQNERYAAALSFRQCWGLDHQTLRRSLAVICIFASLATAAVMAASDSLRHNDSGVCLFVAVWVGALYLVHFEWLPKSGGPSHGAMPCVPDQRRREAATWLLLVSYWAFIVISLISTVAVTQAAALLWFVFFFLGTGGLMVRRTSRGECPLWRAAAHRQSVIVAALVLLFFIICAVLVLLGSSIAQPQKAGPPKAAMHDPKRGAFLPYEPIPYSVCGFRWLEGRYTVTDFAFLSQLAYDANASASFYTDLDRWFGNYSGNDRRLHLTHSEVKPVHFYDFYDPAADAHIIAVRGTASGMDALQDMDIWGEAIVFQVSDVLGPFMNAWPEELTTNFIRVAAFLKTTLAFDRAEYYEKLRDHVRRRVREKGDTRKVILTGHSLGGGLSKLVSGLERVRSVTFSPPGMRLSGAKYGIHSSEHAFFSFSIVPEKDVVPMVDRIAGLRQDIECASKWYLPCHHLRTTICDLLHKCGDPAPTASLAACSRAGVDCVNQTVYLDRCVRDCDAPALDGSGRVLCET